MKALLFIFVGVALLTGCANSKGDTITGQINNSVSDMAAETLCTQLCGLKLISNVDLSKGPCLSNNVVEDWVCDVAHDPRQAVDDDPANQCPEFGKTAQYFVEVDPNCGFIRKG